MRDAGSPSRLGKIYKTYPYTLDALLQVLEEARLRSFNEGPQVITVVTGRSSQGEVSRQGQPGLSGERVHVVIVPHHGQRSTQITLGARRTRARPVIPAVGARITTRMRKDRWDPNFPLA